MAVGSIESHQHPAARPRAIGAGQVDPPVRHLRLDSKDPWFASEAAVHPDGLAGDGVEREDRRRRVAVHRPIGDGHAVRPGAALLGEVRLVFPLELARGQRTGRTRWRLVLMYTAPPCTTGPAVSDPVPARPAAGVPVSLNAQASCSRATFADEIVEPGATLVLARSPFG